VRRPPTATVVITPAVTIAVGRFDACLPYTLAQECPFPDDWSNPKNFSNDAHDPGGKTMCGITQSEYDVDRKKRGLPVQDVRNITRQEGTSIYLNSYWLPHAQLIGLGLDIAFFDAAVNEGSAEAIKLLQHVLGVTANGDWDQATEAALVAADLMDTITAFTGRRKEVYREMRGFPFFGNDWLRRADEIGATAVEMAWTVPAYAAVRPAPNA
jgi:lysozyme family protein